ncbi:MAG: TlpA family protein disulfide reductase [candidate division Zixibacteria bacterium]|nr:TlpA family protein disulfide reductase [candidate division Zixibacteria bacterium]MCI0595747.1 TlpA family protein disulfide reductase [candidate division Zixibacteria bacterium]
MKFVQIWIITFTVLFSCAKAPQKQEPLASVVTTADLRARLVDFKNKPLVVNFWATWCGPCTLEVPDLVKFYESVDTSRLQMIGVSADFFVVGDSAKIVAKVADFLTQKKVAYPNFIFHGSVDSLSNLFNLSGVLPETIIYDSAGREVFRHEDLITLSELQKAANLTLGPSP